MCNRQAVFQQICDEIKGSTAISQCERLGQALLLLGHVSTLECKDFLDIYSPSARKHELVKQGWRIQLCWEDTPSKTGDSRKIGLYVLSSISTETAAIGENQELELLQ